MSDISEDMEVSYPIEDIADIELDATADETSWNRAIVILMLEECLKKKKDLHDSRHRRSKFFAAIHEKLLLKGININPKRLEKKFYNCKKHFITICQTRDRGLKGEKEITWPFYSLMMEIYAEELEIEDAPTMASLYPEPPPPKNSTLSPPLVEYQYDSLSESEYKPLLDEADCENTWSHKSTMALLQLCLKKRAELLDPSIPRHNFFSDIRLEMAARGFNFTQGTLDRKLRNMKMTYRSIVNSLRTYDTEDKRRKRKKWPYFRLMEQIYGFEKSGDVERQPDKSSITSKPVSEKSKSSSTLRFSATAPKPGEGAAVKTHATPQNPTTFQVFFPSSDKNALRLHTKLENTQEIDEKSAFQPLKIEYRTSSPGDFDCLDPDFMDSTEHVAIEELPMDFEATAQPTSEQTLLFYRDLLALEERRTLVAEEMVTEFQELNRIRRKRIQLSRLKLEHAQVMKKQKNNGLK